MRDRIRVVEYSPDFGPRVVAMWRAAFERAVGVTDPHPIEEQLAYLESAVVPRNRVVVALDDATSEVVAFLAANATQIAQLYVRVDRQRRGIGAMLLSLAKERSGGTLRLFTFQANTGARRFYEAHGFLVVGRGLEPEWNLPDLEYEWVRGRDGDPGAR